MIGRNLPQNPHTRGKSYHVHFDQTRKQPPGIRHRSKRHGEKWSVCQFACPGLLSLSTAATQCDMVHPAIGPVTGLVVGASCDRTGCRSVMMVMLVAHSAVTQHNVLLHRVILTQCAGRSTMQCKINKLFIVTKYLFFVVDYYNKDDDDDDGDGDYLCCGGGHYGCRLCVTVVLLVFAVYLFISALCCTKTALI